MILKLFPKLTLNIVDHLNGHQILITNPLLLTWREAENKNEKDYNSFTISRLQHWFLTYGLRLGHANRESNILLHLFTIRLKNIF